MSQPEDLYFLNPDCQVAQAQDDGAYILSERAQHHTSSPLLSDILLQLEAPQSAQSLIEHLQKHPAAHIYYALNILQNKEIISKDQQEPLPNRQTVDSLLHYDGFDIFASHRVARDLMQTEFQRLDIHPLKNQTALGPSLLRLVLSMDFLSPETQSQLSFCQESQIKALPIKLIGVRSFYGPTLSNTENLCSNCLWTRMKANRPIENHLNRTIDRPFGCIDPSRIGLSEFANPVAAHAAKSIADGELPNQVIEFGPNGKRVHAAQNLAACPTCRAHRGPTPTAHFDWGRNRTSSLRQSGYRSSTPKDVIAKLQPAVSDLTGLISAIGPLEFEPSMQHRNVWAATYPITPNTSAPGGDDFHSTAMGKGVSAPQAHASAICEAVERISAQYMPDHKIQRSTAADLGRDAVHPNTVWNFSTDQFSTRDAWNALTTDTRRHVPPALDPDAPHHWVPVWSLTENRQKWMLRELCYINAPEPRYGRFDPNGCAAGMTLKEAALQAMLELVERDCIAIWWYNQILRPGLDPSQSDDANLRTLAAGFQAQGWDSWLLDLRSDLEIPCFAAIARAQSDGRWCIGFGAHFEWQMAAERAMSELAQMFRTNGRDGPPPWAGMNTAQSQFLLSHGEANPQNAPVFGPEDLGDLIAWLTARLGQNDIELLILDQTRPDTGLPVVKTFAPGLRHFWPRLGPGRLFDVPVQMGWLDTRKTETELNPVHLFL